MKKSYILAFCFALCSCTKLQTLYGIVVDKDTQKPLSEVYVNLYNGRYHCCRTDSTGFFKVREKCFPVNGEKILVIDFAKEGYERAKHKANGETVVIELQKKNK